MSFNLSNKEIGKYNDEIINRPVEFGYTLAKDSDNLTVYKIICGNGYTFVCQNNKKVVDSKVKNEKQTVTELEVLVNDKV